MFNQLVSKRSTDQTFCKTSARTFELTSRGSAPSPLQNMKPHQSTRLFWVVWLHDHSFTMLLGKAHILGLAMDLSDDDPFRIRSMIHGTEAFPTEENHKPSSTRGNWMRSICWQHWSGFDSSCQNNYHRPKQRPAMFVVRPQEVQLLVGECHGPTTHNHRVCSGLFLPCTHNYSVQSSTRLRTSALLPAQESWEVVGRKVNRSR